MSASQKDADGSYLVLAYLAFQPSRIKAVLDGLSTRGHTFRKLYQFTVQVCPRRIGILGMDGSLNVCRHSTVSTFGFV